MTHAEQFGLLYAAHKMIRTPSYWGSDLLGGGGGQSQLLHWEVTRFDDVQVRGGGVGWGGVVRGRGGGGRGGEGGGGEGFASLMNSLTSCRFKQGGGGGPRP